MRALLRRFLGDDAGTSAIEYAVIATVVSIVIAGAATTIGAKTAAPLASASSGLR